MFRLKTTVEPGYNDIGLYDTPCIPSDILSHQLIRQKLTITLYSSVITTQGTAVAQWLRCCATDRKVADSNRNEYQEYFLGVKAARA